MNARTIRLMKLGVVAMRTTHNEYCVEADNCTCLADADELAKIADDLEKVWVIRRK